MNNPDIMPGACARSSCLPSRSRASVWAALFVLCAAVTAVAQPLANGTYTLAPASATGQRLDVSGQATADGTNVQIWQLNSQPNQQWIFTNTGGSTYRLSPAHATTKCLDVSVATSPPSGTNVHIWEYWGNSNQKWTVTAVTGGYTLTPLNATGLRLNTTGTANGANVNVTTSNGSNSQKWSIVAVTAAAETVGGGTLASPAVGPAASYGLGGGFTLVKNWNFGTGGTIKNMTDMDTHFQYHDQFNTIGNGANYGAITVASSAATAITDGTHGAQPYVGKLINGVAVPQVRTFSSSSLTTLLVPLGGATTVSATAHNAGNGSFVAKWSLPKGGSLLNQDLLWEVRVRYVTPPYFWFAIWTAGTQWNHGAEEDVMESFGYDNGGGYTNYDGRYWHSNSVGGTDTLVPNFINDWQGGMASVGITNWVPTSFHTWTWIYRKNNTYDVYMDGIRCQAGTIYWTLSGINGGTPVNMFFLHDGGWGHTQVASVNKSMPASNFTGKLYEWDYSRVYLRP